MSETNKHGQISRREFLKDAGLVVGGATIGSLALANACKTEGGATVTNTKTVTTTVTAPGTTGAASTKYICPIDATEYPTLDALKAHFSSAHPGATATDIYTITVNNVAYKLQLQPHWNMAFVLREKLGLFATKIGCDMGQCGSCTVLADGVPVLSCLMLAVECEGKKFQTVEGLSDGVKLNPLQQKFYDQEAFQCGFCTPGILMAATALLASNAKPSMDDVREALAGHVCSCANFTTVTKAIAGGV